MQKLTPCLWFNFNAEEAVNHCLGIFRNAKVLDVSRYGGAMPELKGKVLTMRFVLDGQEFLALNAGPQFPFTAACFTDQKPVKGSADQPPHSP